MTKAEAIQTIQKMLEVDKSEYRTLMIRQETALGMAIKELQEKPERYNVFFADKDHIWINGKQYVSLRRFEEVKKQAQEEPNRSDTIYRQDAIDAIANLDWYWHGSNEMELGCLSYAIPDFRPIWLNADKVFKALNKVPSAQPERKKGEWIEDGCVTRYNQCGECKEFPHWAVCPNCGSYNGGEEHDTD